MSQPNYHTTNIFSDNLLAIEIRRTWILMNKPVYLGLSLLEIRKIVMYEFWHDYMKLKYQEKAKLFYIDTGSFIVSIHKNRNIYTDIIKDVDIRVDTSNYELDRPLPKGKNKKVLGLMKNELAGKITREFAVLRAKTYSYLIY